MGQYYRGAILDLNSFKNNEINVVKAFCCYSTMVLNLWNIPCELVLRNMKKHLQQSSLVCHLFGLRLLMKI